MEHDKDTKIVEANPRPLAEAPVEAGTVREYGSLHVDGLDPVFETQAKLVNHAVQVIGMGKVWQDIPSCSLRLTSTVSMGFIRSVRLWLAMRSGKPDHHINISGATSANLYLALANHSLRRSRAGCR